MSFLTAVDVGTLSPNMNVGMFTQADVLQIILVALVYLFILPIQLVIFPSNYYSVRDVLYSQNKKKAHTVALTRALFIFASIGFFSKIAGISNRTIIIGIGLGSFLCTWPSIYHYQLFLFWRNGIRGLYFLSCLLSVAFSTACAIFGTQILIPMLFNSLEPYLLTNDGISLILQLLGMVAPHWMREILIHFEQKNPYMDAATFDADLCLTYRKMFFERQWLGDYAYEISEAAHEYDVPFNFLEKVLLLEIINRKNLFRRAIEYFCCTCFPSLAMHRHMTVGLAQISLTIGQHYYRQAPKRFAKKMMKTEESIALCAYYLHDLITTFQSQGFQEYFFSEDEPMDYEDVTSLPLNTQLALYVASKYICGCNVSLKKFVLVYMLVLSEDAPSIDIDWDLSENAGFLSQYCHKIISQVMKGGNA